MIPGSGCGERFGSDAVGLHKEILVFNRLLHCRGQTSVDASRLAAEGMVCMASAVAKGKCHAPGGYQQYFPSPTGQMCSMLCARKSAHSPGDVVLLV